MNKKFSTFLAGIALLGAMSANAQQPGRPGQSVNTDIKLQEGKNENLYQLAVRGQNGGSIGVLSVNEEGKLVIANNTNADNVASTLWCVTVMVEDQGQTPKYDFLNKGEGAYLDITMEEFTGANTRTNTAPTLGGEVGGWAFSNIFETGVENNKPLFSYFKTDSVVGFVLGQGNQINLLKIKASDLSRTDFMQVSLREAPSVQLNAKQINTKLGQQSVDAGVKLTFEPDRHNTTLENPFSDVAFLASDYDGIYGNQTYVNIVRKSDGAALYVDTAYTNESGAKFLAFNYVEKKGSHATPLDSLKADSYWSRQGAFRFTYYPSRDSLVIQVNRVTYQPGASGYFRDGVRSTMNNGNYDRNYVTVQDLIAQDEVRIVTVRDVKETNISLGFKGCAVIESNKTSLDEGVYTIRNSKGQYLGVPITADCGNGGDGEYAVGWTTIDADVQDVSHMPAYQWVITKTKTSDLFAPTSPVALVNREYPEVLSGYGPGQLYKDEDGSLYFDLGSGVKATFTYTKLSDEIISNPNLGYKYMSEEELMISNYAFNYFNALSENNYLNILAGDTVLNVKNDAEKFFGIEPVADLGYKAEAYGIEVNADLKKRIPALAQLERAPYYLYTMTADGKKAYIGYQNETTYAYGNYDEYVVASPYMDYKTPFYFKENNHYKGEHYYAFILANKRLMFPQSFNNDAGANSQYYPLCVKVGVADQSSNAILQFQCGCEARTSAFAIGISEQPLYRRFNSLALEGNEGDAADTLRFIEKYRNEYLQMEVNPNFMFDGINFLGIDGADKAKDGKSFYVDSVWVERGLGYIKPQYLVSIDREPAKTTTIKIPCPICQAEIEAGRPAPENCIHDKYVDVEGYERGHYLVNFADSTANSYKWGKYNRVGFVDALHIGDSLYLLIDQFAGIKTEDVDLATIYEANKKKGGIVDGSGYYIKNLKGDAHKYYTWSFRFIDPTIAADEVESSRSFLFESMAHTGQPKIAPERASWLKMQNGCLVMSDPAASTFANAKTGGDDALIFNVEEGSKDDIATDNEVISVEGVNVIAKVGAVRVSGAEGKKVVITNILGQVVANTVITSSDATIAVPAGMVVVAVEGEEAVKAIVK
ncbi:hypothetical protein H8784_14385 [Parabacteroides acidifaciens]|uniref:DUF6383 domain-containing protein n=1 Tax=Parabacteroides acidifaciens TaxID=2290935 RepID=A0A3D8HCY9_9BACT|nr:DUF6383 domain-containing protein [Parabacteroides acidifaciens]MBC8602903.1 hypothetical protein [Parabacteroides acidifaciens]RDU48387.1 hypothetical protein DWU89_14755 [Parabacteroides acidifaciens]